MKLKTKEIKTALLDGGLVVAPIASGKTIALAEILIEDPNSIVFATSMSVYSALFMHLKDMKVDIKDFKNRILHLNDRNFYGNGSKNKYIDEVQDLKYMTQVKAAVTSFPFKIHVIE